jgi:hypothetical protein
MVKQVARQIASLVCASWLTVATALAQGSVYGPYHGEFPAGGDGLTKRLPAAAVLASSSWSMYGWVAISRWKTASSSSFPEASTLHFVLRAPRPESGI